MLTNLLEIAGMLLVVGAAFVALGSAAALLVAGAFCLWIARQRVGR